ncbi:hypothetical protein QM600_27460 [Rhodococcus sp. IEGM 1379]|nr:hypothetical protein [Rhodococcus sp. IEGM 1379]
MLKTHHSAGDGLEIRNLTNRLFFGSLSDTAGGIFGSLDTISFAPPVVRAP